MVLFGQGNGTFQVTEQPALVNNGFIPGDVNHDGKVDLIGTKVFLGQADGTFKTVSGAPLMFQGPTVVADFDGDNALDFFAGATLWKGNGQGVFQVAGSFNFMDGTTATGDFNGDGRIDVVRCDSADVGVLLNSGNGRFDGPLKLDDRPNGPVLARDVNSDGEIDLVATTGGTKEVNVFLGRAGEQFDPAVNYSAGNNAPTALAAADFNGDRRLDLVTANGAGNDMNVLLGTGGGKFAAPTSFAVGTKPSAVATGDFNGDMKPDLAVAKAVTPSPRNSRRWRPEFFGCMRRRWS